MGPELRRSPGSRPRQDDHEQAARSHRANEIYAFRPRRQQGQTSVGMGKSHRLRAHHGKVTESQRRCSMRASMKTWARLVAIAWFLTAGLSADQIPTGWAADNFKPIGYSGLDGRGGA